MATRFVFTPYSAEFPATNFPQLMNVNLRPVLAFDAAIVETCYWTGIAPAGLTGAITVVVHYMMASAVAGTIDFTGALEAITPGDAVDLDSGASIDTANTITAPTVPGTAGYASSFTITMTNADGIAAGDYFRFVLARDAVDAANDTATGDCYILAVELKDAV